MKKIIIISSMLLVIILLSSCIGEKQLIDEGGIEVKTVEENIKGNSIVEDKIVKEEVIIKDKIVKEEVMIKEESEEIDIIEKEVEEVLAEEKVIKKSEGIYTDFSDSKLNDAKGDIVLFFHATWCPPCKDANKSLVNSVISDNLTIFKVDYDSNIDLRKKYGVTYQHTFVQVDNKGNLIKKWSGSRNLAGIEENLK